RVVRPVPHARAIRLPGYLTVERPSRKEQPGSNLDFAVDGVKLVLPQHRPIGTRGFAVERRTVLVRLVGEVPGSKERRRIERVRGHPAYGSHHVRMPVGGYLGSMF